MGQRLTVLECEGLGLVVEGSARGVGLALADGDRQGERLVWLKQADGRLVGVDSAARWEIIEITDADRA